MTTVFTAHRHGANANTVSTAHTRRFLMLGIALASILVLLLSACTSAGKQDEKKTVLTTFTVLADIAKNVAGDHWFTKFVQDSNAPHATVSEGVQPINIAEDAYAGKPNPHSWMSPKNVQIYVDNMVREFSKLDPAHADDYRTNGENYKKQLQQVQDELVRDVSVLPENQRALVTCEGAFSYLAADAGLKEKYIWAVNSEQQATPSQLSSTIDFVRENQVPAVFCESTVSDDPMRQVVDATGAKFGGVLYVDSLSEANGPVPTYLDMIRHDARTIVAGLTGKQS